MSHCILTRERDHFKSGFGESTGHLATVRKRITYESVVRTFLAQLARGAKDTNLLVGHNLTGGL
jgi:hypothetical protein